MAIFIPEEFLKEIKIKTVDYHFVIFHTTPPSLKMGGKEVRFKKGSFICIEPDIEVEVNPIQSNGEVKFISICVKRDYFEKIANLDMSVGSIHLFELPSFQNIVTLIIPLLSIITMIISTIVTMKKSGTAESGGKQGIGMMLFSAVLFGVFSFMYPMGFSLYWAFQNLIGIAQAYILYKICNPQQLREQAAAIVAAKKKAKKEVKTVKVKTSDGAVAEKKVTGSELDKLRLQRARELDAEKYN